MTDRLCHMAVFFSDAIVSSGSTRSMLDMVEGLIQQGCFRITCVFPRRHGTAIDFLRGKPVNIVSARYWYVTCPLHAGGKERVQLRMKMLLGWLNTMVHIAPRLKDVDLVYTNTGVIFTGAWAAGRLRIPHVWHIREFLEEDHGITPLMGWKRYGAFVQRHAQARIFISHALKEKYVPHVGVQENHVIYDDLSPDYLLKESAPWEKRRRRLLVAGTICPGKGQMEAVQACALLKQQGVHVELFLAGAVKERDRAYEEAMHRMVQRAGLESQVHFLGQVKDMNSLRQSMGVGIVASCSEAFGRVTIEGMLAGMVMIGADAAGTAELITHGETGWLYPAGDAQALAQRIAHVLEADGAEVERLRASALEHAKGFTTGACAQRVAEVCMNLTAKERREASWRESAF